MPGRKNPKMTENERDREYWLHEKRGYGEEVAGSLAEDVEDKGAVGEVRRKREAWAKEHPGRGRD